jgi:hypothetical protein
MQLVQDLLQFEIDTPSDEELRNRKGNKQKRLERIERDS